MNNIKPKQFDIKKLAQDIEEHPAPDTCQEIATLLSGLPLSGSLSTPSPTPEQKKAFELIREKLNAPEPEELKYIAEIYCAKYHRIRRDGELRRFMAEKAEELYGRYYVLTGNEEVKYIIDNFDEFTRVRLKILEKKQRKDDFDLYWKDTPPSTSRDPDSDEWKK